MSMDDNLRETIEETNGASLYSVGAFDAIARLLAVVARHQDLDLKEDIFDVLEMANIYAPTLEANRRDGFENVIAAFRHEFNREPRESIR